jgi:hypothetical protein
MRYGILIAACLAAGSTVANAKAKADYMNLGLNLAKTPDDVFAMIGYPDRKDEFGEKTVYYWTQQGMLMAAPCQVQVVVNRANEIVDWSWGGSNGACENIRSEFRQAVKAHQTLQVPAVAPQR